MGVLDDLLTKVMFWRDDPGADAPLDVDGCFTLPQGPNGQEMTSAPPNDDDPDG